MTKNAFIFLLLIISFLAVTATDTDSLYLKTLKLNDSLQISEFNKLSQEYLNSNPDFALKCAEKALQISDKNADKIGKIKSLINIAIILRNKGKNDESLNAHFESLKLAESINDKQLIATNYNNIGIIYRMLKNYPLAKEYFEKAYIIQKNEGNKKGMASVLNNMGVMYSRQKEYDKALESYKSSLQLEQEIEDYHGAAGSFNNIGTIYWHKGDLKQAINYFKMALKIYEDYNDKYSIAMSLSNIAVIYIDLKEYSNALEYCEKSMKVAREMNDLNSVHYNYLAYAEIYSRLKDFEKAFNYHTKAYALRDSIILEENNKKMIELQQQFESEKKEKEILILTKEKKLKESELSQKQTIIWLFLIAFLVLAILGFFLIRSIKIKNSINKKLEIAYQNIEEKNKDITDSINYAKQIQQAILPFKERFEKYFNQNYFILFQPRDIVSGDFYWSTEKDNLFFVAVVDCTGHGVPGAFMSMVASAALSNIVNEKNITYPGNILTTLHKDIRKALNQENGTNRDGMDLSLCAIDFSANKLFFAGANNSLLLIKQNAISPNLEEIKGNNFSIGGMQLEKERIFDTHEINLEKGFAFYLTTDGFADQFGGPKGKKFKSKKLKELLLTAQYNTLAEQKNIIYKEFIDWKGDLEQVDDICILGFKI
jgi:serine phosphatase RsbU (regulator of sigma subunit)/Tfp pilus assembly protein PilF